MTSIPVAGQAIAPLEVTPSEVQLFLFSAATANPHRIHYDEPYSRSEGYDGVVVQSHLHACLLARAATESLGPRARVRSLSWQNRAVVVAGDTLTVSGEVVDVVDDGDSIVVTCRLEETLPGGVLCVRGEAVVVLPADRGDA
jgi:hydroxyacyl-ACP dehydratase HTD2-like protein with hotdog domain